MTQQSLDARKKKKQKIFDMGCAISGAIGSFIIMVLFYFIAAFIIFDYEFLTDKIWLFMWLRLTFIACLIAFILFGVTGEDE